MLISEYVETRWNNTTKRHFELFGYKYTKNGDKLLVKVEHLLPNSGVLVEFICDYCGAKDKRTYQDYLKGTKCLVPKDCCNGCTDKKYEETLLKKYGVTNMSLISNSQEKKRQTNIKKYGSPNPMGNPDIQKKAQETSLKKYGTKNPAQNEQVKEKAIQTNMKKYGFKSTASVPEIREKQKQTIRQRYGVENVSQNKEIRAKVAQTMYKNETAPRSSQQNYLSELFNGECNYPLGSLFLDIAFPDEKIYIEYDGGGHNLRVKFGIVSEERFEWEEIRRSNVIRKQGWKEIRIVSSKDLLPSDDVLKNIIKDAIKYLNSGHSWIRYDIDNSKVECSQYILDFNFGEISKIA